MTGAPLPEGADCVLMQELTNSGEETVQLYAAMKPQQNVVFRAETSPPVLSSLRPVRYSPRPSRRAGRAGIR